MKRRFTLALSVLTAAWLAGSVALADPPYGSSLPVPPGYAPAYPYYPSYSGGGYVYPAGYPASPPAARVPMTTGVRAAVPATAATQPVNAVRPVAVADPQPPQVEPITTPPTVVELPASTSCLQAQPAKPPIAGCPGGRVCEPKTGLMCPREDCKSEEGKCGIIGGAGIYYVRPHWDTNQAFTLMLTRPAGLGGSGVEAHTEDFSYDTQVAPRVWLGYGADKGLGVRAGWYRYDDSANTEQLTLVAGSPVGTQPLVAFAAPGAGTILNELAPLAPNTVGQYSSAGINVVSPASDALLGIGQAIDDGDDQLTLENDVRISVFDLEATWTYSHKARPWSLIASAGARYAHLHQQYSVLLFDAVPGFGDVDLLKAGTRFKGVGPTIALEGRYQLGHGLALVGSTRSSYLFGSRELAATRVFTSLEDVTIVDFVSVSRSRDETLPIIELELGAEWGMDLGPGRLVAQAAWVTQFFSGLGSATTIDNNDLSLRGLSLTLGIQR